MGGRVLLPVLHEAETITSGSGTTMRFNCGDGHLSHSHGFKVVGGLRPGAGCFWASGPRCQARLDGRACGRDGTQRDDSEYSHMLFCSELRYASIVNLCVIRPVSQRNAPGSSTSYGLEGLRLCRGHLDPGHIVQQLFVVQEHRMYALTFSLRWNQETTSPKSCLIRAQRSAQVKPLSRILITMMCDISLYVRPSGYTNLHRT